MRLARLFTILAIAQAIAGVRVIWRLARTTRGERIRADQSPQPGERVTVIVPVLNEQHRLAPCLAGLSAQPEEVTEILVVDGGSCDGTQEVVTTFIADDRRVRLLDAGPPPGGGNGKVHGLQGGLEAAAPTSTWVLTIDADVRVTPALTRSLLAHARRTGVAALSVATKQQISGASEGLVHPALLTTLVYRYGIPGHTTRRVNEVQANGQCTLYRREPLEEIGGFATAGASVCEDVTIARALASHGYAAGFYESDDLAAAAMYGGWREAWQNWPRSLSLRDVYSGLHGWLGLSEVTLAQALPLPLLLLLRRATPRSQLALTVNCVLLLVRIGVLAGTARAYLWRPWTYWLSPLADLPAVWQLWRSALQRRHTWRGRTLVRDDVRKRR